MKSYKNYRIKATSTLDIVKGLISRNGEKKQIRDYSDIQVVVLVGEMGASLSPVSCIQPVCLLSVNNRPALFNIITKLVKQKLKNITFIVNRFDIKIIQDFIDKTYSGLNIAYIVENNADETLKALQRYNTILEKSTLMISGSVSCDLDFDYTHSFIGCVNSEEGTSPLLINEDGTLKRIYPEEEKQKEKSFGGVCFFKDIVILKYALAKSLLLPGKGKWSFWRLINHYNSSIKLKCVPLTNWYDAKDLESYVKAMRQNINGRCFNSFNMDDFGVITKRSTEKKLLTEMHWLEQIAKTPLAHFCPHYLGRAEGEGYGYKMEYLEYLSLAEYFTYYDISNESWRYIFENLLTCAKKIWDYEKPKDFDIIKRSAQIYETKTDQRTANWERQDLLSLKSVCVNGNLLFGYNECRTLLADRIKQLSESSADYCGVLHGDMCFGNILYAPKSCTFKFIDPRGDFGGETIYGDVRYDAAKMRHNYHGLFDYITNDLFDIVQSGIATFKYSFYSSHLPDYRTFDNLLVKHGFDIDDIELIEGLLFISMIPLHSDNKQRQMMFFLTALECLNNQIKKNSGNIKCEGFSFKK